MSPSCPGAWLSRPASGPGRPEAMTIPGIGRYNIKAGTVGRVLPGMHLG
jgi:hypothetical protein